MEFVLFVFHNLLIFNLLINIVPEG